MRRRFARVFAVLMAAALVATACGDDSGSSEGGGATTAAPATTEASTPAGSVRSRNAIARRKASVMNAASIFAFGS